MSETRYCRWCGRPLTESSIRHKEQRCRAENCIGGPAIIEPENGRWWRDLLSPEAKAYVETNYPEDHR